MAEGSTDGRYPIRAVSRLTGIGIDTLRAWERRYGAVDPVRDRRGRMYSDADVARLRLLSQAVSAGHGVGRIARFSQEELQRLVSAGASSHTSPPPRTTTGLDFERLHAALLDFDSVTLDQELWRLASVVPPLDLIRDVLMPTLARVGDRWNEARSGIAHEHLMSGTLLHLLGSFLRLYGRGGRRPRLLFATPSGERHEIGILAAAMVAASYGLSVTYLGPELPASEIFAAVKATGARAFVMGLTLSGTAQPRDREVRKIVRDLPPPVALWAGGAGTAAYEPLLGARGLVFNDFDAYAVQLLRLGGGPTDVAIKIGGAAQAPAVPAGRR